MMTISFDAIWIPIAISALGVAWAAVVLRDVGSTGSGILEELSIGIAWPAIPVLGSWLIWALLA